MREPAGKRKKAGAPIVALLVLFILLFPRMPYACTDTCPTSEHNNIRQLLQNEHIDTRIFVTDRFKELQLWFMGDDTTPYGTNFFSMYIAPAVVLMTEHLTVVGMHQMYILGGLFDAKHQLETQRLMHAMAAEAHKDYHPSTELCSMGTAARGLAPTARTAEVNAAVMMRRSQDRQLGHINTGSSGGIAEERANRLNQFKSLYCDINDNNQGLASVCGTGGPPARINKDIDYARTLGDVMSLDVDLTNAGPSTPDEEDLLALAANLFAHEPFDRVPLSVIRVPQNQDDYLDARAVVAKRSIAENSFYAIAGMKAAGSAVSPTAGNYTNAVLEQLGMPAAEAAALLGQRPSYYALMDILAQKMYQRPEFFSALYDKPANVIRKDVAMQAVDLMLGQDSFKSELRYEALLAVLLELETIKYQDAVQNRINWIAETGEVN